MVPKRPPSVSKADLERNGPGPGRMDKKMQTDTGLEIPDPEYPRTPAFRVRSMGGAVPQNAPPSFTSFPGGKAPTPTFDGFGREGGGRHKTGIIKKLEV